MRIALLLAMSLALPANALSDPQHRRAGEPTASQPPCTGLIRDERFVRIGGIEQWVTIRGESCANPAVLFLHGGPGNPLSPYSSSLYGPWEKDFTIVQWDQRGSGQTWARNPATAEGKLLVARMAQDGIEVAEHLKRRLGKTKIILVGSSWGSILGAHMASARPDLFHLYVGVGQIVSYRSNQAASYRKLVALARTAGDIETVQRLETLGPPPWKDPRNFGILRRVSRAYEARTTAPAPAAWWVRDQAYSSPAHLAAYEGGEEYSYLQFVGMNGDGMFSAVDLSSLGARFELPIHLVLGAEDLVTVPEVAREWFDTLSAPTSKFILLDRTGHDPNPAMMAAIYEILTGSAVAADASRCPAPGCHSGAGVAPE